MHSATIAAFRQLLDTSKSENTIQTFIEQNPWMLTLDGPVASKLPLGAEFRVDFAFGVRGNGGDWLYLLEIERPDMAIFNANDEFSQPFNHAIQQIIDWAEWCRRNRAYLYSIASPLFGAPAATPFDCSDFIVPRPILIAGRRSQLSTAKRKRRFVSRANSLNRNLSIRTYDDFLDSIHVPPHTARVECVRYRDQTFVADEKRES